MKNYIWTFHYFPQYLDLSRNQLYGINADTALRIQGIRNVRLDNNPLICDECHMGKLINVVRQVSSIQLRCVYAVCVRVSFNTFSKPAWLMNSYKKCCREGEREEDRKTSLHDFHIAFSLPYFLQLQWKWDTYPICFLPKSLRGSEIINLDIGGLHTCLDYTSDEEQNAASTSYNFLEHGEWMFIIERKQCWLKCGS